MTAEAPGHRRPRGWPVLLAVWVLSAAYTAFYVRRGWIPHDEGTLGQTALRVLAGELPHRDFADVYTGGLSFLHAAVFRVAGPGLVALRLTLYGVFLAWVPALWFIAARFTRPAVAGLLVAVAVAWSLPNYVAALPSWYNLFLATFGTAALLRYLDTGGRRWLFVAGACGGLSIVLKVVGLFYVAAALLFFAYREQTLAESADRGGARRGWGYTALLAAGCVLFLLLLLQVLWARLGAREAVHFLLPSAALVGVLLHQERRVRGGSAGARLAVLLGMALPFLAGVALPLGVFLLPYLEAGAVPDLLHGVFVAPSRRLGYAAMRPPRLVFLALAALPLLVFLAAERWRRPGRPEAGLVLLALVVALVAARAEPLVYRLGWYTMRSLGPVVVLAGAWVLAGRGGAGRLSGQARQGTFLLLCMAALLALVQFPFTSAWYFWYVAPFVVLAGGALLSALGRDTNFAPLATAGFYLLFAVGVVNVGSRFAVGSYFIPRTHTAPLRLERAEGIQVSDAERAEYERLVPLVRARARGGYAYAGPDAPEVYFLAGLRNPTPTLFDFFDDPRGRTERVLSALERHGVSVVAINHAPGFSDPMDPRLAAALAARYPNAERVGRFTVRWR